MFLATLVFLMTALFTRRTMSSSSSSSSLSSSSSSLSGPGLNPSDVVLPCRYFWIRGAKGTDPNVTLTGRLSSTGRDVRIRTEVFRMEEEDLFLVRYQTRATMEAVYSPSLDGWTDEGGGGGGPVQPHGCRCPRGDFQRWFEDYGCRDSHPQVEADLSVFADGIDVGKGLSDALDSTSAGAHSFCHYAVVDNRIHRRCYGEHVGFKMFPDATFSLLARMVRLPDTEFLINLGDWPLARRGRGGAAIPMMSWCKTNETDDVLLPTYELTEASAECMGRQILDMLSVQGNANLPWTDREPKAFFRGRDSSRARLKLVRLAREHPDLIEAGITRFFFFRDEEAVLGTVPHASFFDFFKYKYQISLDGTVAAYRFPLLMAGGSLILKQDSDYVEHFYRELEPWVHYVPVRRDLGDLVSKVRWALANDGEARRIAVRAREFARERLMPREVFCYHALVVREWTKRLKGEAVAVREGMEEVGDGQQKDFFCSCERTRDEL